MPGPLLLLPGIFEADPSYTVVQNIMRDGIRRLSSTFYPEGF